MIRTTSLAILFLLFHVAGAFVVPATTSTPGMATLESPQPIAAVRDESMRQTALSAYNKKNNNAVKKKKDTEDEKDAGILSKPANLIILPFVALFGLDLVANILVVVKRTIEVLLTGQYTCTGPWC